MMHNQEMEAIDRDFLADLQLERLQMTINRALDNVNFYRQRFMDMGLEPGDVTSLDDLRRLPFTTKADLMENSPYGLLAVPLRDIVRFHTSSGAIGRTCIAGYTKRDLGSWRELMARVMAAAGVTSRDIVQVAFAYGLFTGGAAFEKGAEALGASVVPASVGPSSVQVSLMQNFRTTVLACTPSFALRISETLEKTGVDPKSLDLRIGLFGAEPWSEETRTLLEERFFIRTYDQFGLAELIGPGVAGECPEHSGLHLAEDHFLPEIIDPGTGDVLPPGEEGELVLTTLSREAQPLIRYRTGDLTRLDVEPCPCGRTLARLARISRRTDDVIIFRGISVLPGAVERVLESFKECRPHYEMIVVKKGLTEELHVQVETTPEAAGADAAAVERLTDEIASALHRTTGVGFRVFLLPPGALTGNVGRV